MSESTNADCPQLELSACPAALRVFWVRVLDLLIGECHWRPGIATPLLAYATQAGKWHVRPRDHNILARELRQQSIPRRRSRSRVDVEDHRHLGVLQLDAL